MEERIKMKKSKFFIFCFLLFVFTQALLEVNASELRVSYEDSRVIVTLINCPEPGLGSYYLVFSYEPENAQILEVSPKFLADYNSINKTILIAGVQGELPGPTGDIELVEIVADRGIKLKPINVNIKDVNGSLIYCFEESQSLVQVAQTPVNVVTPISHSTDAPTSSSPAPSITSSPSSSISGQQEGQENSVPPQTSIGENTEVQTFTPTKTASSETTKSEIKKIPSGDEVLVIIFLILLVVMYVIHLNRRKKHINRRKVV